MRPQGFESATRPFRAEAECIKSAGEMMPMSAPGQNQKLPRRNSNGRFTSISGHPERCMFMLRAAACLHTLRPTRVGIGGLSALGSFEGGSTAPSKAP
jgi:hypothetical protein